MLTFEQKLAKRRSEEFVSRIYNNNEINQRIIKTRIIRNAVEMFGLSEYKGMLRREYLNNRIEYFFYRKCVVSAEQCDFASFLDRECK